MEIRGTVEEIIYEGEDGIFKIAYVRCGHSEVTIKGQLPFLNIGESIVAEGTWTEHREYGRQFIVSDYKVDMPTDTDDVIAFLSSGLFPGIGEKTALNIVAKFKKDTIRVILEEYERLCEVKGITSQKAEVIHMAMTEHKESGDVIMFFNRFGISSAVALSVYRTMGKDALKIASENPYRLYSDVRGVAFKTADEMAKEMGLPDDSYDRLCACLSYILKAAAAEGNTYLPKARLINAVCNYTGVDASKVEKALLVSVREGDLAIDIIKGDGEDEFRVYLGYMYDFERYVERRITELADRKYNLTEKSFEASVVSFEGTQNIKLDEKQKEAVRAAGENGALIITGGPGTGKTTLIRAIIRLFSLDNKKCILTAPTGRAAKRMASACGMNAKTIHRLLETNYDSSEEKDNSNLSFARNESNPLSADVIIVDEMSMVDIVLMNYLLRAIKPAARLIMVGDKDQLPPVGPGMVLRDILTSGVVPVITLDEIYRQNNDSLIAWNAREINNGRFPLVNEKDKDFFLLRRNTAAECADTLCSLCSKRLPDAYGIDPMKDIQVIIPSRKGVCGVANVNARLQSCLNPPAEMKAEIALKGVVFREGDRVMQTKNNYSVEWTDNESGEKGEGIFNGEMGQIISIDNKTREITMLFDDSHTVIYDYAQMADIEHCYAVTVHKSQGSEYDYCIIAAPDTTPMLMTRNLLYTAVTRAKKLVIIVGSDKNISYMIENNVEISRYSGLFKR